MSTGAPDAVAPLVCAQCSAALAPGARFCEGCGTPIGSPPDAGGVAASPPVSGGEHPLGDLPISAPTRRPAGALADPVIPLRVPCTECGGEVGPDGYCLLCGTKAPSERDHFREQPASWVAGVCDKAVRKRRNEDAMALLASPEPGGRAVLVVLDGVSNSVDSDVASLAGARAAREVLRTPLPAGMGTPASRTAAVTAVMTRAAAAANAAIVAVTDPESTNPASATFVAVVVEGARLVWAGLGDSRCYWLPDAGEAAQLSVDDSVAAEQIAAGVAREVAETGPQAHAITKWLGRDADDIVPTVGVLDVEGPGWVLACSDGLWNYASEPAALRERLRAAGGDDPLELALSLVRFANDAGGHDNITVALARIGGSSGGPGLTLGALGHNADDVPVASGGPAPSAPPADPAPAGGVHDG